MSLRSKRRSGELKLVRLRQKVQCSGLAAAVGDGVSRSCRCTPSRGARERRSRLPTRCGRPSIMPKRSISTPPRNGAIMIGNRLITDCIPIPMEWRFASSVSAIREKVAGQRKAGPGKEEKRRAKHRAPVRHEAGRPRSLTMERTIEGEEGASESPSDPRQIPPG